MEKIRRLKCQEETEQDRREPVQEPEWAVAREAKDGDKWAETALAQGHLVPVSAPSVASALHTQWEHRATR